MPVVLLLKEVDMLQTRLVCLTLAAFLHYNGELLLAQETDTPTAVQQEETQRTSIFKIIAEPKTSRPFDWNRGDKITVGVRCVSDNGTRVVGIATDVELVAIRPFDNRVEMMLRADVKSIDKIKAAAEISEFWFEIMPFEEEHRKTLKNDVEIAEFLKANPNYHAVDETQWGYGALDGRLQPPTKDELPKRKR